MYSIFSGQSATAAFIEGNDVSLLRYGEHVRSKSSIAAVSRIFKDATDIKLKEISEESAILGEFEASWAFDRALRLSLILLDETEYAETKEEAASCLEEFFENGSVTERVANQLAWTPLPVSSVVIFEDDDFARYPRVSSFFTGLVRRQTSIRIYHDGWNALSDDLFDSADQRVQFREECISRGAFRVLSEAGEGSDQANLAAFKCYQLLHDLPNHRAVVQSWTQKFLKWHDVDQDALPGVVQDIPYVHAQRTTSFEGSRSIFTNVIQQQEEIKRRLHDGNLLLALRYTNQLVSSQLRQKDGAEYAAKSLCRLAQEAKRIGLYSIQLEWATRATTVCPGDAWAHGQAADSLIQFGRLNEAFRELERAESLGDVLFAATGRARILRMQHRLPEALRAFRDIIEAHHDDPEVVFAWRGAAETLRQMWRLDEALKTYQEAADRFRDEPTVICGKAAVLTDLGQLDLAYEVYGHVLYRFGNQVVALNGRATVLREMGRLPEALEAYQAVISKFPDDTVARCGFAEVKRLQGNFQEALATYAAVITDFPYIPVAYSGYAEVLRDSGDLSGALQAYTEAKAKIPHEPLFGNGLATIYKAAGDLKEALAAFDQNALDFPFDLFSKLGRADILKRLGRSQEALDAYDQVLEVWPRFPVARNSKAALLVAMGRFDEATALLPAGLPQTEAEWVAYHIRGMIMLKTGASDEAVRHFTRGSIEPSFSRIRHYFYNALAIERIRSGKFTEAAQIIRAFDGHTADDAVSNILLFHAEAAERLPSTAALLVHLGSQQAPIIIQLRDEIAARYGITTSKPLHDLNWIIDRQFEAVLLDAA
jgi:tetratricopeptide (TPR) repeat protein